MLPDGWDVAGRYTAGQLSPHERPHLVVDRLDAPAAVAPLPVPALATGVFILPILPISLLGAQPQLIEIHKRVS